MKWIKKIRRYNNTIFLALILGAAVFCLGGFALVKTQSQNSAQSTGDTSGKAGVGKLLEVFFGSGKTEKPEQAPDEEDVAQKESASFFDGELSGEDIYTFLQGPKAWESQVTWSGEWCKIQVEGNTFGGFGCGFCCMANIYSTLTEYECSPSDIFLYAMEVSDYVPSGSAGAIDWEQMRDVLEKAGMSCRLCNKPDTYEEFQQQMEAAPTAVALVSSEADASFWTDTSGHYVNIWMYYPSDDTVMIAEPGSPANNRTRIPLRYVYDALKTLSIYQYLRVDGYSGDKNEWKWDGIDDDWVAP